VSAADRMLPKMGKGHSEAAKVADKRYRHRYREV
jgi:hypothetical protein